MSRVSFTAAVAVALAVPAVAAAERPASVGLGVDLSASRTPVGAVATGAPARLEAGGAVEGPLWWFGTATFGHRGLTDDWGEGNTFALRTGPRVVRCGSAWCVGAGLELGWAHEVWRSPDGERDASVDAVTLTAGLHGSVSLDRRRRAMLEVAVRPHVQRNLLVFGDRTWDARGVGELGLDVGVTLVVRN